MFGGIVRTVFSDFSGGASGIIAVVGDGMFGGIVRTVFGDFAGNFCRAGQNAGVGVTDKQKEGKEGKIDLHDDTALIVRLFRLPI